MNPEQPPFYIGRYLVTGKLGTGGMGVVYLATDERLQRKVAVKQLLSNPNSRNAHARIRREALLLAQLNHSNIVQIYDVVEDGSDIALVMEYVDGSSLERWQRERSPDLRQKLQLLRQICAGLSRAHAAGIIHRDLKSENILIDSNGTVKITDFGIAKNSQEESNLTREQHIAGSWGAMSPEQAQGKAIDHRSDLFALGVLAYRLLCGQNPFGDNRSPYVIIDRVVNAPHPPAAKLCPELPAALSDLLDRLLAKKPQQRPVNASAVADELDALLGHSHSGSFTHSHSLTATVTAENYYRGNKRWFRSWHRALAPVATMLGISVVALFGYHLWQDQTGAESGKYIAVLNPAAGEQTREQQLLANNIQGALKQGLSGRDGLYLIPYAESQKFSGQSLARQVKSLNADLVLVPNMQCERITCELSLELVETAHLSVISSRSTRLSTEESLESRARTLQQLNYLLPDFPAREGNKDFAISAQNYQRYLELYDQRRDYRNLSSLLGQLEQLQQRASAFAPLYELYGEMAIDQEHNSRSAEADDRLENLLQKVPASIAETPEVLVSELRLAMLKNDPGRAEALLARLKLTLPDKAGYYHLSSLYHQQQGDLKQALGDIDRALALRTSYAYLTQKALTQTLMGDMPAANQVLQQAVALNGESIDAISLLAGNLLDSGDAKETVRLLTEAGLDRIGPMDTYNLCLAYYIEKQYAESQDCFGRVSELAPKDADPLLYRAEIAREQKHPERAAALAAQALALTSDRDDWEGLLMQARAYAELGEAEKAVENLIRIRRTAPDDLYVNYARAQVYITTGDLLSAKAHIRKTLEQGISPVWYCTARFVKICNIPAFDDLRQQYPGLCGGAEHNNAGNSQIARNGAETSKL
ncbi:serine/threonine-protein kinase [uncultured Microbulbifer sp.]|uniref:serine/threonine-protein kinase n=1 Tax=uncultured Microbulbifer sp. TaxID=348147 RepID=UPI0025EA6555|nr:serine/threonine-protein kinase [uncultured Microbulbifer sp.]